MTRLAAFALALLAAACVKFESPTEPLLAAAATQSERYTLNPPSLTLKPASPQRLPCT